MMAAWRKALRFAALPGATRVQFRRQKLIENGTPTVRYSLRSETQTGDVIGDERDYDLLKAAMVPLEQLAEHYDHDELMAILDLETDSLTLPQSD